MTGTRISHSVTATTWAVTETNPFGLLQLAHEGRDGTATVSFTLAEEQRLLAHLEARKARRAAYATALEASA